MNKTSVSKVYRLVRVTGIICLAAVIFLLLGIYVVGWLKLSNKEFFSYLTLRPAAGDKRINDMKLVPGIKQEALYKALFQSTEFLRMD